MKAVSKGIAFFVFRAFVSIIWDGFYNFTFKQLKYTNHNPFENPISHKIHLLHPIWLDFAIFDSLSVQYPFFDCQITDDNFWYATFDRCTTALS